MHVKKKTKVYPLKYWMSFLLPVDIFYVSWRETTNKTKENEKQTRQFYYMKKNKECLCHHQPGP